MFLRRHSVCGMLILSLTGNRIRDTPMYEVLHYYYTHYFLKSKPFLKGKSRQMREFSFNLPYIQSKVSVLI